MYKVEVMIEGPEGEDLSYTRYCDKDELRQMSYVYDRTEMSYVKIPDGIVSSDETMCQCPICHSWTKKVEKKKTYHCDSCQSDFYVK